MVADTTFRKLDTYIWLSLWRWAVRRHPDKGNKWIAAKYFKATSYSKWVFYGKTSGKKDTEINPVKARKTAIVRHVLIKGNANPYDPDWDKYFEQRDKFKKDNKASRSSFQGKKLVAG